MRRCGTRWARPTPPARTRWFRPTLLALPDGKGHGVLAEYFDNADLEGEAKLRRPEPRGYFDMGMEDPAVIAAVGRESYSVRWTATLTPAATGEYELAVRTGPVEPHRHGEVVPRRQGARPSPRALPLR